VKAGRIAIIVKGERRKVNTRQCSVRDAEAGITVNAEIIGSVPPERRGGLDVAARQGEQNSGRRRTCDVQ
jgi:hypothetical protein